MPEAASGEPVDGVRAASAVPGAAPGVLALPGVSVRGRERLPGGDSPLAEIAIRGATARGKGLN